MTGLNLGPEDICKAKFKPWFEAGGWTVQEFTNKQSAEFQIPEVIKSVMSCTKPEGLAIIEAELKKYAASMNFPHDGEATRGQFMFCFDYKSIQKSVNNQVLAVKEDYDKYWSWHKPFFYLLFYTQNTDKIYIHEIRDPIKADYQVRPLPRYKDGKIVGSVSYYNVTADCVELKVPEVPITFPKPPEDMSIAESYAMIFAANRWADQGYRGKFEGWTEDDLIKAKILFFEQEPLRRCMVPKLRRDVSVPPRRRKSSKPKPSKRDNAGEP